MHRRHKLILRSSSWKIIQIRAMEQYVAKCQERDFQSSSRGFESCRLGLGSMDRVRAFQNHINPTIYCNVAMKSNAFCELAAMKLSVLLMNITLRHKKRTAKMMSLGLS